MIHTSPPATTITDEAPASSSPSSSSAEQMPVDLRALALCLGGPFAGLSTRARRRLAILCNGFAELLWAGEDLPEVGDNLRSSPRFLLSALFALRTAEEGAPLSAEDEGWMVAEVEADFGEALALFEMRTGKPRSPVPPRPLFPLLHLEC